MLIRQMTPEDVSAVAAIEFETFSQPWSEKSFLDSLGREDTVFLVCEKEENEGLQKEDVGSDEQNCSSEIVGYIGMYLSFDEAEITNVAVASSFRKRGCGKMLIEAAKQAALDQNATQIFLEVRMSNEPAIALYRKMGFEEIGIRKNFYERPTEDAKLMKVGI